MFNNIKESYFSDDEFLNIKNVIKKGSNELFVAFDLQTLKTGILSKLDISEILIIRDYYYKKEVEEFLKKVIENNSNNYKYIPLKIMKRFFQKENNPGFIVVFKQKSSSIDMLDLTKNESYLVLNQIELPGNLGTILRSANLFNIKNLILIDCKTSVYSNLVTQSSRGANMCFNIFNTSCDEFTNILNKDNQKNYNLYLCEPKCHNSLSYNKVKYNKNISNFICFGGERFGINKKLFDIESQIIHINQLHDINNSLNVSAAASIILSNYFDFFSEAKL